MSSTISPRATRWLLWSLLALLWLGTLGYRDLIHPDEGRYAEISREMVASGDWITPRLNGLKYFEKPALQYWASATLFSIFGENEWSARLWPGLTGLGVVILLWYTARRLWNEATGDITAILSAGGFWLVADSRFLALDMANAFFMTLTLCSFLLSQSERITSSERGRWMLMVYASAAAAVLTKGLIGIVLPGAVLVLYLLITRRWTLLTELRIPAGVAIFLALTAPWFIVVSLKNPEFAHFFFIHEHVERYLTTEHNREGPWYYFIPIFMLGMLPWLTLIPTPLVQAVKKPGDHFEPALPLIIWSVFIFVFFSRSGSKLPSYILPVFPAVTLLLASWLDGLRAQTIKWHAVFIGALFLVVAVIAMIVKTKMGYYVWIAAGAVIWATLSLLAGWCLHRGGKMQGLVLLAAGSLIGGQIILLGHQTYSPLKSSKTMVMSVREQIDMKAPIYSVLTYDQTLPFYLGRTITLVAWVNEFALGISQEPDKVIRDVDTFITRWNDGGQATAVMDPETLPVLAPKMAGYIKRYEDKVVTVITRQ